MYEPRKIRLVGGRYDGDSHTVFDTPRLWVGFRSNSSITHFYKYEWDADAYVYSYSESDDLPPLVVGEVFASSEYVPYPWPRNNE